MTTQKTRIEARVEYDDAALYWFVSTSKNGGFAWTVLPIPFETEVKAERVAKAIRANA